MTRLSVLLAGAALAAIAAPAFAQSASEMQLRINRLEEQVRQLTGQNEEYQHQIRQLQQLGPPAGAPPQSAGAPRPGMPPAQGQPGMGGRPPVGAPPPGVRPMGGPPQQAMPPQQGMGQQGQPQIYIPPGSNSAANPNVMAPPPTDLGSLSTGPNGAPMGGAPMGQEAMPPRDPNAPLVITPNLPGASPTQMGAPGVPNPGTPPGVDPNLNAQPGGQDFAIATPTGSPEDEYALGAGFLQRKDYEFAETQFKSFLKQYPSDQRVPDALYGLGESFYQRGQHSDAIEPFLEVVTKHGSSPRAADSMLRLGQTLGAIDQKEQACATLLELGNKYPRSNAKSQSAREMSKLGC
jgi:tol-pal system protein YbgF